MSLRESVSRTYALRRRARAGRLGQSKVQPVDRFTAAHAALGFSLGLWGAPWWVALLSTLGFELVEDGLKRIAPGVFPVGDPDTWSNSILDSAAWMAGWGIGRAIPNPDVPDIWK